jgi:hypothetical protein
MIRRLVVLAAVSLVASTTISAQATQRRALGAEDNYSEPTRNHPPKYTAGGGGA